jgi:hypothetical protein
MGQQSANATQHTAPAGRVNEKAAGAGRGYASQ